EFTVRLPGNGRSQRQPLTAGLRPAIKERLLRPLDAQDGVRIRLPTGFAALPGAFAAINARPGARRRGGTRGTVNAGNSQLQRGLDPTLLDVGTGVRTVVTDADIAFGIPPGEVGQWLARADVALLFEFIAVRVV